MVEKGGRQKGRCHSGRPRRRAILRFSSFAIDGSPVVHADLPESALDITIRDGGRGGAELIIRAGLRTAERVHRRV